MRTDCYINYFNINSIRCWVFNSLQGNRGRISHFSIGSIFGDNEIGEQRKYWDENLQLIIEKRAKLVQTRSELERFQISSNDFNCSMRLNDSDGNVFTTSFTPGVKKVIDFLKLSFDSSISEAEDKINFWTFGSSAGAELPFFMVVKP